MQESPQTSSNIKQTSCQALPHLLGVSLGHIIIVYWFCTQYANCESDKLIASLPGGSLAYFFVGRTSHNHQSPMDELQNAKLGQETPKELRPEGSWTRTSPATRKNVNKGTVNKAT